MHDVRSDPAETPRPHNALHRPHPSIPAARIVDAHVEGLPRGGRPRQQARGRMQPPIHGQDPDVGMRLHLAQDGVHRVGGAGAEELVDVDEAHPRVFVAVDGHAVLVHGELLGEALAQPAPAVVVVEVEGEGGAGDRAVGLDAGEWVGGRVVHDVEAGHVHVVVVVVEPFGEVLRLVFDEEAEGEVFLFRCGFGGWSSRWAGAPVVAIGAREAVPVGFRWSGGVGALLEELEDDECGRKKRYVPPWKAS